MADSSLLLPSLYIPHGGGPCFFIPPMPGLPSDLWDKMARYLSRIAGSLAQRPKALLIISAHWETELVTVNAAANPDLLFDYYGFPESSYRLTYPATGSPRLAARVRELLTNAGIESDEVSDRGLDHGVFIPMKLVFPEANIPIVQLSLNQNLSAATHLAIGHALTALRGEGVLIIGSGMSYHNLRSVFSDEPASNASAAAFDRWLGAAATDPDPAARNQKLAQWFEAPGATGSHPRPEHLIPLMVAAGAAGAQPGRITFNDVLLGKPVSGFQFG